jgi:hypothetical protein
MRCMLGTLEPRASKGDGNVRTLRYWPVKTADRCVRTCSGCGRGRGREVVELHRKDSSRADFSADHRALIPGRLAWNSSTSPTSCFQDTFTTPHADTTIRRAPQTDIMARFTSIVVVLSAWFVSSSAQFGFFDQMFGNQGHQQHQQHQEPQNVRSDSSWYQAQYEGGESNALLLHISPVNL